MQNLLCHWDKHGIRQWKGLEYGGREYFQGKINLHVTVIHATARRNACISCRVYFWHFVPQNFMWTQPFAKKSYIRILYLTLHNRIGNKQSRSPINIRIQGNSVAWSNNWFFFSFLPSFRRKSFQLRNILAHVLIFFLKLFCSAFRTSHSRNPGGPRRPARIDDIIIIGGRTWLWLIRSCMIIRARCPMR